MNKRARNRLIGVTAIILIVVVAILLGAGSKDGAYSRTVSDVAGNTELVGERVKVSGEVVAGSWDRKANPMRFEIRNEKGKESDPTIKVEYSGGVPSTFGDGVVAVVTGELSGDADMIVSDDMITKCPSKYESNTGAMPVADLVGKGASMEGTTVKITGFIKAGTIAPPGGAERFAVAGKADGTGDVVSVVYEGALPAGMDDGSEVVVTGALEADGKFVATDVALSK